MITFHHLYTCSWYAWGHVAESNGGHGHKTEVESIKETPVLIWWWWWWWCWWWFQWWWWRWQPPRWWRERLHSRGKWREMQLPQKASSGCNDDQEFRTLMMITSDAIALKNTGSTTDQALHHLLWSSLFNRQKYNSICHCHHHHHHRDVMTNLYSNEIEAMPSSVSINFSSLLKRKIFSLW